MLLMSHRFPDTTPMPNLAELQAAEVEGKVAFMGEKDIKEIYS